MKVTKYGWAFSCIVLLLLLAACSNDSRELSRPPSLASVPNKTGQDEAANLLEQQTMLTAAKAHWAAYQASTPSAINYRHFAAGTFRTAPFIHALDAYWFINGAFPPAGSAEGMVTILEDSKLLPFWPLDPETGQPIRFVPAKEDVTEFRDVFPIMAANGTFDFYFINYDGRTSQFEPYFMTFPASTFFDSMSRVYSPPDLPDSVYETPADPAENFSNMIYALYRDMVIESFKARGGTVPTNLQELMANRFTVNPSGWGSPADRSFSPGEIGDFEFGILPTVPGYYMTWTSSIQPEGVTLTEAFVKSLIAGEEIYDVSGDAITSAVGASEEVMDTRIPLLTDEMFTEPPPDL